MVGEHMYLIKKIFYPEIFQGKYKKKNYFEGWYFKNIDSKNKQALAVIPGISYGKNDKDAHAFIQILNINENKLNYFKYDISCFDFSEQRFEIKIEKNYFSAKKMILEIENNSTSIHGQLLFKNTITYPKTLVQPGIMGPFSFVPFMECYHGIVSIHHDISGKISYNGQNLNFNEGYGYIEKDWGRSFPSAWIWFQSNHFQEEGITLMFSIAKIPWFGRNFTAFISFFRVNGKLFKFSTYTKASIKKLIIYENSLEISVEDNKHKIEMRVINASQGLLKAPKNGMMEREILESIDATIEVQLMNKNNEILYQGIGTNTGLEVVCDKNDFQVK